MNPNLSLEPLKPQNLEVADAPLRQDMTPQDYRASEINEALMAAYRAAGTLVMTPEEIAKLTAPFPLSVLDRVSETGHTYIPHIFISQRLTQVFGPGQWTMIRRQEKVNVHERTNRRGEKIEVHEIMAEWIMVIRGVFIGESWGSKEYYPSNVQQTYADVLEATRGECIRRIAGKYLACGGEAWDPKVQRQMSMASARERLEAPRAPQPAPVAPPTAAAPAPADPIKALKAELWGLLKPHCKTQLDVVNWLGAFKILPAGKAIGDLTADELSEVLDKTKIQLKDMK